MTTSGSLEARAPHAAGEVDGVEFRRFLRCSHLLSSALRELLVERFLHRASPHAISQTQFCFLKLITLNPDLQLGEVARRLNISPAATSKALDRLEEVGLVSRLASPEDRRATLVQASDDGRALVRSYEQLKAAAVAPVIGDLGPDRLDVLCQLLEQVCIGLLREEGTAPETCLRCAGYPADDCRVAHDRNQCGFRPRLRERAADTDAPT